ncbi:hypothetical protein BN1013_00460 [Candidatus Rubidus massiliensis]|nr:hypothetical protein BN1013_00460 [Candidatus Rubidus massiliensis]
MTFQRKLNLYIFLFLYFFLILSSPAYSEKIYLGIDQLFTSNYSNLLQGRKVGLITHHAAINREGLNSVEIFKRNSMKYPYKLTALYAPEHGITGAAHASEFIKDAKDSDNIPIYSLHGKTKRLNDSMVKNVDLLVYDMQDIGSRSYTYITTLFYVIEEAAKYKIPLIVLDRPNPINGLVVDGPMFDEKWRSMVGHIDIPYCHGMTVGELASFFNDEYKVGCNLQVIPMKGWKRPMSFYETGLDWIPTSPNIPEPSTPLFYPITGIIGELNLVNIGIGYTLPFKLIGAPWINANTLAQALNKQKFPGVTFKSFYYKPFYGKFANKDCEGVLIVVTNPLVYQPVSTQYLIIGLLKSLYPKEFKQAWEKSKHRKDMFCKVNGTDEVYNIIDTQNHIVWKLKALHQKRREKFLVKRKKYLINTYASP